MQDILIESLERFLQEHCPLAQIRALSAGASTANLWKQLDEMGYANALLPEDDGGAGFSLRDARGLLLLLGKQPAPVPLAETMMARAVLNRAGLEAPSGPIILATPTRAGRGLVIAAAPLAQAAEFVLAQVGGQVLLLKLSDAVCTPLGIHGSLASDVAFNSVNAVMIAPAPPVGLREIAATLTAAQMAGAMAHILNMTIGYANERVQFGKPIAKFQAVQQQMAVLAEKVLMADMAVQLACDTDDIAPHPLFAAIAKQRTGEAAAQVAAIAHAVHGAIGMSEEYDLQLYTGRLAEWRIAHGSETYWSSRIGAARLASNVINSVDFVREAIDAEPANWLMADD